MAKGPKFPAWRLVLWAIWLIAECELLLVRHYEVRTELRQLFKLPLYHILLTFLALVAIEKLFAPRSRFLLRARWNWAWPAAHIGLYSLVSLNLERWWWQGRAAYGSVAMMVVSSAMAFALLGSWLAAWLPVSSWRRTFREEWQWIRWVFPASLAAPYLAESASNGWEKFSALTMEVTRWGLVVLYDPVICRPKSLELGTEGFVIQVLPGCSGLEGMGLLALLASAYVWVRRGQLKFPRSLALIPLAVGIAYAANILRLIVLIVIGTELSASIALRGFHSQAGWLSFTVLGLGLIALAESLVWFHRQDAPVENLAEDYSYPALPYLMPLAAMLVATLLVQATTGRFPYTYGLKPLLAGLVLQNYRRSYPALLPRPSLLAVLVGIVVWVVWAALVRPGEAVSPYQALSPGWSEAWIALRMVGGVLVVPLVEELAFRGYLMRRLQGEMFEQFDGPTTVRALIFSSVAFGLMHDAWLAGILAGLAYGWVATRRGGLSNAVVAHMLTNLLLAVQVLVLKQWGLW